MILVCPIYVGRLTHWGRVFEGQDQPTVDPAIFEAVKEKLQANHQGKSGRRMPTEHLIVGRIQTAEGHALPPSHTTARNATLPLLSPARPCCRGRKWR